MKLPVIRAVALTRVGSCRAKARQWRKGARVPLTCQRADPQGKGWMAPASPLCLARFRAGR